MRYDIKFRPNEKILSARDFTKELRQFFHYKGEDVSVIKESLSPIVEIDNKIYYAVLEFPHLVEAEKKKDLENMANKHKWIYLVPYT